MGPVNTAEKMQVEMFYICVAIVIGLIIGMLTTKEAGHNVKESSHHFDKLKGDFKFSCDDLVGQKYVLQSKRERFKIEFKTPRLMKLTSLSKKNKGEKDEHLYQIKVNKLRNRQYLIDWFDVANNDNILILDKDDLSINYIKVCNDYKPIILKGSFEELA